MVSGHRALLLVFTVRYLCVAVLSVFGRLISNMFHQSQPKGSRSQTARSKYS
jgi:hypothetical protein